MKRLLALICAGSLCLSFTACGSKKDEAEKETEGKYQDLIEMLEDEDYEDAMEYIRDLADFEQTEPETTIPTFSMDGATIVIPGANTEDAENSPLLPYLMGTWQKGGATAGNMFMTGSLVIQGNISSGDYENVIGEYTSGFDSYTFRENGTCIFGDTQLSWEPYSCTDNSLNVRVYQDDVLCYAADLTLDNGEYCLQVSETSDGFGYMVLDDTLFNPDHYNTITVDGTNWQEYFEFTHQDSYSSNSFGEATGLSVAYRFTLKPEHFNKISKLACVNGALELDYTNDAYNITVDYATQSYTIGEKSDTQFIATVGGNDSTYTLGLGGTDSAFYGVTYASGTVFDNIIMYPTDMQVVRLQVTLYMPK